MIPAHDLQGLLARRFFRVAHILRRNCKTVARRIVAAVNATSHISTEALENETISPLLGSVMFTFKRIEDKLADLMERTERLRQIEASANDPERTESADFDRSVVSG